MLPAQHKCITPYSGACFRSPFSYKWNHFLLTKIGRSSWFLLEFHFIYLFIFFNQNYSNFGRCWNADACNMLAIWIAIRVFRYIITTLHYSYNNTIYSKYSRRHVTSNKMVIIVFDVRYIIETCNWVYYACGQAKWHIYLVTS